MEARLNMLISVRTSRQHNLILYIYFFSHISLWLAAESGYKQSIALMIAKANDAFCIEDQQGNLPHHYACREWAQDTLHEFAFELFLRNPGAIHKVNGQGMTPQQLLPEKKREVLQSVVWELEQMERA